MCGGGGGMGGGIAIAYYSNMHCEFNLGGLGVGVGL